MLKELVFEKLIQPIRIITVRAMKVISGFYRHSQSPLLSPDGLKRSGRAADILTYTTSFKIFKTKLRSFKT